MPYKASEVVVEGISPLEEIDRLPHGRTIEQNSSSAHATTRPPHCPSSKIYKYEGSNSSAVHHVAPLDHAMKSAFASSASTVVSKRSHKASSNFNHNQPAKENEKLRIRQGDSETGDLKTLKKVTTLESDDSGQKPASDVLKCNANGNSIDLLNAQMQSKLAIGYCPSPQNSFYSATHYTEAKQSFTNTEVSECVSSLGKSVESGGEISNSGEIIGGTQKTSSYRQSDGSDISDESSSSSFQSAMNKPHKANDARWEAIQAVRLRNNGSLELKNFRLLKKLGAGDIGSVHLSELIGTRTCFAIKVMDKEALVSRKKLLRAQTEREILQSLDHPFLPTLYAHFETEKFSFLAMEFCPGGDLHALRQKQPGKYFPEHAARFYLAEVLLALEYLHMLGIIYRDLKPENILVREDGHIMLSDFDLSLRCAVSPTLVKSSNPKSEPKGSSGYCIQPSCIEPSCAIQPACIQPTCFGPRILGKSKSDKRKKSKSKSEIYNQVNPLPELMAEPTSARSMSFVGTHEYLAPEIIKGEGHGSAVDWWTLGIFLYELLFGRTPFKGAGNRATLFNVVGQPLRFPDSPTVSFAARDLIRGLLIKEPQHRLAYRRGATEIKQHPFFQSVNWALIRCATPPEIPPPFEMDGCGGGGKPPDMAGSGPPEVVPQGKAAEVGQGQGKGVDVKPSGNYYEIDFF